MLGPLRPNPQEFLASHFGLNGQDLASKRETDRRASEARVKNMQILLLWYHDACDLSMTQERRKIF
jgi:hypothetical protein